MWNVIESAGIRREVVEKNFPTPEDVTELYFLVEKRLHYQREQDMIKKLKEYVEKLKHEAFLEMFEKANKQRSQRESQSNRR